MTRNNFHNYYNYFCSAAAVQHDDNNDNNKGYQAPGPTKSVHNFEIKLPVGLSTKVQSALTNATTILQQVDTYTANISNEEKPWSPTPVNVSDCNPARAVLEYHIGFIEDSKRSFTDVEMIRPQISVHFLGDTGSSTLLMLSNAARALLQALNKAKRVQDLPPNLFDLRNNEMANHIWTNSGFIVNL
ncbi:unnamed protein product [Mycena citricolor]|uniref:Uncharacterized protein n=1 Tax=Mycena citricolor TaxID=2018698 RepID=A0AAD2Q3F7_9AGAR|nr:unnamed protein product [Mycena citricolor]